jgi:outer membrane protein OmpA-like peptidoglycan-associated protein
MLIVVFFSVTAIADQGTDKKSSDSLKDNTLSSEGKSYPDGQGGTVFFPLGDISFADEVVSFNPGSPSATNEKDKNPKQALGIPDYNESKDINYTTLGCGGTLVLRFTDNALCDIEGADLYVFEIGPQVEPTLLSISQDGTNWVEIGEISGGKASVDIKNFVKSGDAFHYIRLVDLKSSCGGDWPGADIDAVGAIGSVLQFTLNSSVLFDFNKSDLKERATSDLKKIVQQIKKYPQAKIIIEGHTDAIGSEDSNLILSRQRAQSVKDFFVNNGLNNFQYDIRPYGKSRPIADNSNEEGRAKNRRVVVIVIPK